MGEIRFDIFDKVYSCYYRVVQKILEEAKSHPITRKDMETIAAAYGYGESALTIVPKLLNREWDLLRTEDGKTFAPKTVPGRLPLTLLQRSWLKALLADRRISCFLTPEEQKKQHIPCGTWSRFLGRRISTILTAVWTGILTARKPTKSISAQFWKLWNRVWSCGSLTAADRARSPGLKLRPISFNTRKKMINSASAV
ncbi:hypothetical protein LC724_35185 [Blautia sp. RD014234]|nr:hypothetical protein [Blautia parvula]